MCDQLGLGGWVKNTRKGTIVGKIQGSRSNVEYMYVILTNNNIRKHHLSLPKQTSISSASLLFIM